MNNSSSISQNFSQEEVWMNVEIGVWRCYSIKKSRSIKFALSEIEMSLEIEDFPEFQRPIRIIGWGLGI